MTTSTSGPQAVPISAMQPQPLPPQAPAAQPVQAVAAPILRQNGTACTPPNEKGFLRKIGGSLAGLVATGAVKFGTYCMSKSVDTSYSTKNLPLEVQVCAREFAVNLVKFLAATKSKEKPILKTLDTYNPDTFAKAIESTLLLAAGNLVQATPTKRDANGQPIPPSLVDIASHINWMVNRKLHENSDELLKKIEAAEKAGRKDKKDQYVRRLLTPVIQLAFPNGKDDLPVRNMPYWDIRGEIWEAINCPELLTNLYDLLTKDTGLTGWLKKPTSQNLGNKVEIAHAFAKYIARTIMNDVVTSQLDDTLAKALAQEAMGAVHEKIAAVSPFLGAGTGQVTTSASNWISKMTTDIVRNNSAALTDEAMKKLQALFPSWYNKQTDETLANLQEIIQKGIKEWLYHQHNSNSFDQVKAALIDAMLKACPTLKTSTSPSAMGMFEAWLDMRVEPVPKSHPYNEIVWEHAQKHLEELFLDVLSPVGPTPPSFSDIVTSCLDICEIHRKIIAEKYEQLAAAQGNNTPKLAQDLQTEIDQQFTLFANDILLVLKLDKDKKFKVLLEPLRNQLAKMLSEKIYPAMVKPGQKYPNIFHELCRALYEKEARLQAKKADSFGQLMANPNNLTHAQQQLLWHSSGIAEVAKNLELTFKGGLAPIVRASAQSYFSDMAMVEALNSALGLKLSPAASKELQQELAKLAKGNSAGTKGAWDYVEHLSQVTIPKVLISLITVLEKEQAKPQQTGGALPISAQPQTIKMLPQEIVTKICDWMDEQLKEDRDPKTGAKRPSFDSLLERSQELTNKLKKPQLILEKLKLLKTKYEQKIPVLQSKLKACQTAANSLPSNQKAEKVKLINGIQTELQNAEKQFQEQLSQLVLEMKNAEADLQQHAKEYEKELQDIREQMQARSLQVSKELLSKIGNDFSKEEHPIHDWPIISTLKGKVWNKMIPEVLSGMILSKYPVLQPDTRQDEEELNIIFEGKSIEDTCEALEQFISGYVKNMLAHDQELTQKLFELFKDSLPAGSSTTIDDFKKLLKDNEKEIIAFFKSNTQMIGKAQDPALNKIWSLFGSSGKSIVVQLLSGTSKELVKMLASDPHALSKYMTREMVGITDYVQAVNAITKKVGVKYPYEVDPDVMMQQLQQKQKEADEQHAELIKKKQDEIATAITAKDKTDKEAELAHLLKVGPKKILHPALRTPIDPLKNKAARKKETEEAMLKEFARPLVKKLLKINGYNKKVSPKVLQFMEESLLPPILQGLYAQSTSRNSMKQLQLTFVNNLQTVCEDIERQLLGERQKAPASPQAQNGTTIDNGPDAGMRKLFTRMGKMVLELLRWLGQSITTNVGNSQNANITPVPAYNKELQEMVIASGKVLHQLVDWLPGTAANALIKNVDTVKKMTEEQLGGVTHDFIMQRDVITDFLKPIMQASTASLHPGKWQDDRFITPIQERLPSGILKNKWDFNFQPTRQDLIKQDALERRTRRLASSNTRTLGNYGMDVTIMRTWNNVRQTVWEKVAYGIERATEATLKSGARPVQIILKAIFALIGAIAILGIYSAALFALPFYWAVTRVHIALQVNHLEKSMGMDANHSLILYALEDFVDQMDQWQNQQAAKTKQPAPATNLQAEWTSNLTDISGLQTKLTALSQSMRTTSPVRP